MDIKKLSGSLLFRVLAAIVLGIICSFFFPQWLGRIFATFNSFFSNFLNFFVPVLIFALVTPAIAGLGRGAGKWLGITAGIAYVSTVISGLVAYGVSLALYDWLLADSTTGEAEDIEAGNLVPYFEIEIPAPFEVMTALVLAFAVGLAMTTLRAEVLYRGARELEQVVMKVIEVFIIPLLPVFIFGMFLSLGMNGNLMRTLTTFGKVLLLAVIMTVLLLIAQYLIAGAVAGKNPLRAFITMLPAYATALGTSSSAATIPVTRKAAIKNGVTDDVAGFVIPLCATIHLAGSMMKISLFAFAVMYMDQMPLSTGLAIGFIFMLAVTMVAAPGVPGGAIMAATGLLASMMGFDDAQVALMIASYIAIDSFGTAANVTGDGAIALIINRFVKGAIQRDESEDDFDQRFNRNFPEGDFSKSRSVSASRSAHD